MVNKFSLLPSNVIENKIKLDGRIERFECRPYFMSNKRAILSYIWHRDKPYSDGPAFLPAGAIYTDAFYWIDRNYLIYKLRSETGELYGHRIDVCQNVKIEENSIHWLDLILDFWISPTGEISVLDEEEFKEASLNGVLNLDQTAIIENTKLHLLANYKAIIYSLENISLSE